MDEDAAFKPGSECPKCQGSMESGFMLDRAHAGSHQAIWCPGVAELSYWTGSVKGHHATAGVKIITYRCAACGYLESYAPPGEGSSPIKDQST